MIISQAIIHRFMYKGSARGFTLVELMVTLGLFTLVITLATGALFSAQAINARLQQTQVILDGVNLATEIIGRDIRYGTSFSCVSATSSPIASMARQSCTDGDVIIVFRPAVPLTSANSTSDRVAYFRGSDGAIYKQEYPEGSPSASVLKMTTPDVSISTLTFYVVGASAIPIDYNQPVVTFSIAGITRPAKQNVPAVRFTLQTSASSRQLDN